MNVLLLSLNHSDLFYTIFQTQNGRCMACTNAIQPNTYGVTVNPRAPVAGITYPDATFCYNCSGTIVACAAGMTEAVLKLSVFCCYLFFWRVLCICLTKKQKRTIKKKKKNIQKKPNFFNCFYCQFNFNNHS